MEHLVVSSKTAKKLKAAGWNYVTIFSWWTHVGIELVEDNDHVGQDHAYIAQAPTAQELADQLTAKEDRVWSVEPVWQGESDKSYVVQDLSDRAVTVIPRMFFGDDIADVLAQLWLSKHEAQP